MSDYKLPVNGDLLASENSFDVINPATGKAFARCPLASADQIDFAIESAQKAFPAWAAMPLTEKRKLFMECAAKIKERGEEIARILTMEQGKTLPNSMGEIAGTCGTLMKTTTMDIPEDMIEDTDQRTVKVIYKPLGVVGAIAPFNFPLTLASWKIAPALWAGNTMVLKPSPDTSLSTLMLGEIMAEILPPGVLNIITGFEQEGQQLISHPAVKKVTFTGSIPVGKIINGQAAPDLKRVTLELGGNDAAIILPDCDPQAIAPAIFGGGMVNNGQTCVAIKRIYVHEDIHDDLVKAVTAIAEKTTVGDGLDPASNFGPLVNEKQLRHVEGLVDDAREKGATIHCGGKRKDGDGYFYLPTVVSGLEDGVRLVDEEQFGPVLPFISYSDPEDALRRANSVAYGLGGSVWTKDTAAGEKLATRMDSGMTWVNTHPEFCLDAPFGGAGDSGIGAENGVYGLKSFTQMQTVIIKK